MYSKKGKQQLENTKLNSEIHLMKETLNMQEDSICFWLNAVHKVPKEKDFLGNGPELPFDPTVYRHRCFVQISVT